MEFEDRLTIRTPEGVDLQVTLAGLGSRTGAALVDAFILGAITVAVLVALSVLGFADVSVDFLYLIFGFGALLVFVVFFGYYLLFETLNSGRTPGKAAFGIRVIRLDGTPLGFGAVTIRTLLRIVDALPVLYAAGLASILVTARNQRIGDLVAGTVVVRDGRGSSPPSVETVRMQVHGLPRWDVSRVTEDEVGLVHRFLERSASLQGSRRGELASSIAAKLRPKVAAPDAPTDDEAFLSRLVAEKRRGG